MPHGGERITHLEAGFEFVASVVIAVFVYAWLGLKSISISWFNLDVDWALSLMGVGTFGIYSAFVGHA